MEIRNPTGSERNEIETTMGLDLETLYSRIPNFMGEFEDVMFAPGDAEKAGQRVFSQLRNALHSRLCVEWRLCDKIDHPALQDSVTLIVAVADVISSVTMGIPPFLIAAILMKLGIRSFCDCEN